MEERETKGDKLEERNKERLNEKKWQDRKEERRNF